MRHAEWLAQDISNRKRPQALFLLGQVHLGFSVSSSSSNAVITAQFRDISNVTNGVVGVAVNPHEGIGPSNRTTPIVISEIMWKPAARFSSTTMDFVR